MTKYGRYVAQHFIKENETLSPKNDPLSQQNAPAKLYLSNRNVLRPFSFSLRLSTSSINFYFHSYNGKL